MKTKLISTIAGIVFLSLPVISQTVTLPYNNATDYVQNVLVGGGVTVTNVTSNCIFNAPATMGYFNNFGVTPIVLNEGIIMSSGDVQLADDPNSIGSSGTTSGTGSDPQLAALIPGYPINDAAVLQFDFVPLATPMTFRYVFASEEYPEWVNSSFNDVFGFFVTGPNPGGGNYTNQNIAIIPGTTLPVTIDNVNANSYSQYYVNNAGGSQVTYDAFTTVLTAQIDVVPCVPYHIKIAVGDAGDSAYDSAVFLEANSFSTDALDVNISYTNPGASVNAVEGCNDGVLTFTLSGTAASDYTINYTVTGTASNGTDYVYLPGSAIIPAGSSSTTIVVSPVNDGITEGSEIVTLIFQSSACGSDTIEVVIEDPPLLTPNFTVTTPVCANSPSTIDYTGVGADTYTWDFDGGTQSGSGLGPFDVTWSTAGTYDVVLIVNSPFGCGTAVDTMQVLVNPIPTSTFTATSICENDTSLITYIGNASSGASYNWSFPSGIPSVGAGQGPHHVVWNAAGTYTLSLTVTENGCTSSYQVDVVVMPPGSPNCCAIPVTNAGTDFSICGNSFNLNAIPDVGLGTWTCPSSGVNISDIHSPVTSVNISGAYGPYTFTWTENNGSGCTDNDQIVVTIVQIPNANAGIDHIVCGTSVNQTGSQSVTGSTITWSSLPPAGVSFTPANNAVTNVNTTTFGTFQIIITETNSICSDKDTAVLQFLPIPAPNAGTDQTVCGNSASLAGSLSIPSNTGYWSGPSQISFSDIYDSDATAYAATFSGNQVSYTLQWHETNGICDGTDDVVITFVKPPLANAGYGGDVCDYEFTLVANITGVSYVSATWTSSVAGINIIDPTNDTSLVDVSTVLPGGYDPYHCIMPVYFTWSVTAGTGCTSSDSVLVYFYDRPESFAGDNDSICGLVYDFQAVPSIDCSSGQWSVISQPSGSSAPDFNNVNDPNTTVSVTSFGYWEFQWNEWHQSAPICNTKDTVRIHFIETPTIDAGPRDTVCGHWVEMQAITSGFPGTWITPGGGFIFASGPDFALEDTAYQHINTAWVYYNQLGDSAELVWRECMGFCCSYDTVMILFDEEFPAIHLVDTTGEIKECGKITTQLDAANPQQGTTGYWYDEAPLTTFNPTPYMTHPDSTQVTYYGTHNFHWVVVGEFETCRDTTAAIPIQFIEPPIADAGPEWDTVCGYCYELDPVIPAVGTGFWTSTVMTGVVWFETTNTWTSTTALDTVCTSILNTGGSTPYYNIVWNVQNDICTDADTIRLIYVPEPTGDFTVRHPYCIGDVGVLTAMTTGDNINITSFTWDLDGGIIDSTLSDLTDMNPLYVSWDGATGDDEHTVTLVVENGWGCRSDLSVGTMQEPPAMAPPMAVIDATCGNVNGQIIFLTDTGEYSYAWMVDTTWFQTIPDSIFVTNSQDSIYIYNITGDSTYYFVVQGESQSYSPAPIGTFCIEGFGVYVADTGYVLADFDTASFSFADHVVPEDVSFQNLSNNGNKYRWIYYTEDGEYFDLVSSENGLYSFTEGGCYDVMLIAQSRDGCLDTTDFLRFCLEDESLMEVPNVFSPNGDGKNDVFRVHAKTIVEFNCIIMDRWGKKMYEWSDVQEGWNGKLKGNGADASPGVYYYIITATGQDEKTYEFQGSFTLLKEK